MEIDWALVAVAFGVGALVGLTGVGAGAIMTPVLVGFFGVSLPVAIATDLIFATATKLIGAPLHHRKGSINWAITKGLWWGSIPGTVIGVGVVLFIVSQEQTQWLVWPLVIIIFTTSLILGHRAIKQGEFSGSGPSNKPLHWAVAPAGGFGIGSAVAMTSVGAGALGMALLLRLSPRGVNPRELVGTDLVHAIPIALISGATYGVAGLVHWTLLATMVLGSAPGVILGSLLAGRLSARVLNGGLSIILLGAALSAVSAEIS